MNKIYGYGEDALTLWALKNLNKITKDLSNDLHIKDDKKEYLIFFRPSFGRGRGKADFGEFDAILAFPNKVYLIESKWDNLKQNKKVNIKLSNEQVLRHKIFSWYLEKWDQKKYCNKWSEFEREFQKEFIETFPNKKIASSKTILAKNLEYVLTELNKYCGKCKDIENILLYFYNKNMSKTIEKVEVDDKDITFNKVINIDYGSDNKSNFIFL